MLRFVQLFSGGQLSMLLQNKFGGHFYGAVFLLIFFMTLLNLLRKRSLKNNTQSRVIGTALASPCGGSHHLDQRLDMKPV